MHDADATMTPKQAAFIKTLAQEALGDEGAKEYMGSLRHEHPRPTMDQASDWIADLKARKPKDAPTSKASPGNLPDVNPGRYAVPDADGTLRTYRVDRPLNGRFSGYVFVKLLPEDETRDVERNLPFPQAKAVLDKIAPDPRSASVAYGRKTGVCGVCGRTLTHPDSVAAGIGPVCASK